MGQLIGLVETAFALAPVIKRDRHEPVPRFRGGMMVEGRREPVDQPRTLMKLVPILEPDDGFPNLPLGPITGPGPLEIPLSFEAMVTNKIDGTGLKGRIRIAALAAKWRDDGDRFRFGSLGPGKGQVQRALPPLSGKTEG